jgi:hypothetical protein
VIASNNSGRLQKEGGYLEGRSKSTEKLKFRWLVSRPRFRPEHKAEILTSTLTGETPVLMINREYKY